MTSKTLRQRVERLQPSAPRSWVLYQEDGQPDMDVRSRAAGLGYPVIIAPRPCKTTEEWLQRCSGLAGRRQ